jgi:hypothetical protein
MPRSRLGPFTGYARHGQAAHRRRFQSDDEAQDSRFPAAGCAYQTNEFRRFHLQVDALQYFQRLPVHLESLANAVEFEDEIGIISGSAGIWAGLFARSVRGYGGMRTANAVGGNGRG